MGNNIWSDVSGIAQRIESDAYFVVRETATMQNLVKTFRDASGMNVRRGYKYNQLTANEISDGDAIESATFTPSADNDLTPVMIGQGAFVSDARAESMLPETIINDVSVELGLAAADKVETDLLGLLPSLTGGTVGTTGGTITWGYIAAAIAQARNASKNSKVPLACVIHGYQYSILAKAASIAGSSLSQAQNYTEEMTRSGYVANFMGVPIYQVFGDANSSTDFVGGVFPMNALALDWRKPITIEPKRDVDRVGYKFVMSAIYAKGVWRPELGVQTIFHMTAPTS
jgi:hypothetical protein